MKFVADFHIHSHFSLATSGLLTPEHLDRWGRIKGIKVLGTGDFTHPGWLAELREKLMPAEPGLFGLKREFMTKPDWSVPETEENSVRFLLTAEVSCIYKKDGRVRKVHNVIFAPDFETAEKIQRKLKALDFNITSDGRPILGMDSRDLLELALDASPGIFFVPAHIWTPWFSALGDKSGFDRIDECYADLSNHIHAVESGLSSDPAMNDLCSHLDRYSLISNSDAHSPEKLGREANRFDTVVSTFTLCSIPDIVHALGEVRRVLKPGGQLLFLEHGRAPDPDVARWQDRLNGAWMPLAGGCHLNRPVRRLIEDAGLAPRALRQYYLARTPRFVGYLSEGVAVRE